MDENSNKIRLPRVLRYDHSYGRILIAATLVGAVGCGSDSPGGAAATGGAPTTSSGGAPSAGATSSGGATSSNGSGGGNAMAGAKAGGGAANGGSKGSAGSPAATGGTANGGAASGGSSSGTGGSNTGGTPVPADAGAEVSLDELGVQLADASCGALEACLGAASTSFFDGASCQSGLEPATKEGSVSVFPAAVSKGTLAYDPTKVDECLASIRSSGCDYPNRRLGALCPGMVVGKVAIGGACSVNAECGASAYCKVATCPGLCTALVAKGQA